MSKYSGFLKKLKSIKHIEMILAILIGLIVILIFFSSISSASNSSERTTSSNYIDNIETKLENLISEIDGVGRVEVMLMGEKEENSPEHQKIVSAVVVTDGANNVSVKINIIKAVQTLLKLDSSCIEVLKGT